MGFANKFDGVFSSAYVGCMKHDTTFFLHVLHELDDMEAKDILFWDDSPGNVAIAKEVGFHAELYRDFADFEQKINLYLKRS